MKKLSARQYALAIDQVLQTTTKSQLREVAARLLVRLRRDRTPRLVARIIEQLRAIEAVRHGRRRVTLEVAGAGMAASLSKRLVKAEVTVVVRPELQRGVAIIINDKRIDATLAGHLQQLHRSLLST